MPGESPMTLPWLSAAPMIGLAYTTEAQWVCPNSGHRATPPHHSKCRHPYRLA